MPHKIVSQRQCENAKNLRRGMTDPERRVWAALRAHRFAGYGFRRQAPLGRYVVDFVCHRAKLVVELDGEQHGWRRQQALDVERDQWLQSRGYEVLRIWNHDVMTEFEQVLETIWTALATRESPLPPNPSPARGGARRKPHDGEDGIWR